MHQIVPVVSFPKSGNTWLRFLLANLYKENEDIEINFKNINSLTSTSFNNLHNIDTSLICNDSPYFVKQHVNYNRLTNKNFQKAIYIHRDGFDTLFSYWHFMNAQKPDLFTSQEDFVKYYWSYCGHWGDHIKSWTIDAMNNHKILCLNYSELKNNPNKCLNQIVEFVGVKSSEQRIFHAIEKSSSENMKAMGSSERFMNAKKKDFHFVRSGKNGEGINGLSDISKKRFLSHKNNNEMLLKHYDYNIMFNNSFEKHPNLSDLLSLRIKKYKYNKLKLRDNV